MDGFARAIIDTLTVAGVAADQIHTSRMATHIPGFFRATKAWDILVVRGDTLVAAIELKSQVGSFGNNFNNRTEEAMGTALDTWIAWREGAYRSGRAATPPFLGYLLLVEDSSESRRAVRTYEPHFNVRTEFIDASYVDRYELFCRKLVVERQYSSACLLVADQKKARLKANYAEPAPDLSAAQFMNALVRHCTP